jgi:hypothetical protein
MRKKRKGGKVVSRKMQKRGKIEGKKTVKAGVDRHCFKITPPPPPPGFGGCYIFGEENTVGKERNKR